MKGVESYENGTKESWSRWIWRRVVERLPEFYGLSIDSKNPNGMVRDVCSQKTVVYLAGPHDRDREHAKKFGFRNENLIAIDCEHDRVLSARLKKVPAVCGKLEDVITNWPSDWPIDVVIADLCCGFNGSAHSVGVSLVCSEAIHDETVIAMCIQRGRDQQTNHIRDALAMVKCDSPWRLFGIDPVKQRAFQWLLWMDKVFAAEYGTNVDSCRQQFAQHLVHQCLSTGTDPSTLLTPAIVEKAADFVAGDARDRYARFLNRDVVFQSYKSPRPHSPVMDSLVMKGDFSPEIYGVHVSGFDEQSLRDSRRNLRINSDSGHSIKPRLAAMRAVRTRRIKGVCSSYIAGSV